MPALFPRWPAGISWQAPSHTLPTGGAGKSFSGLRADQFQRRTSVVRMNREAVLKSAPYVAEFARVEGLDAHNHSIQVRAARVDR